MIIYRATNKVNGKCYIGQTRHSLEYRKRVHLTKARQGIDTHFYSAIRKYGEDNFVWDIICSAKDKDTLNELETFYITKYDSIKHGYNMVDGGDNNIMDIESVKTRHDEVMRSPEVRAKISASMKKLRREQGFSEEHRRKISEAQRGKKYNAERCKLCDTRSVGCYCVYDNGEVYHCHSYLHAGLFWYRKDSPFPYSEAVYQRKIKQSIELGYCTYGRGKDKIIITNPKWYIEEVKQ